MHPSEKKTSVIKTILIIEDEGEMCLLINLLLDNDQTAISHVNSLTRAQEYLLKEQPTLILLDNRLPDGFGLDFLSYLKTNYPEIKIIMISGIDAEAQDAALEMGADSFLSKPFTKNQLQGLIDNLLN
jgi:two-component system OmpR family response regulator